MLALGLALFCVAAILGLLAYRTRNAWTPQQMAATLPVQDAVVLYVDLGTMRQNGLLNLIAGSKAVEEAEYRKFVDDSGFDYKTDLERVAISFQSTGRYVVAVGKFDWNRIKAFALRSGAECVNAICEVKSASFTDRSVSFYPMHNGAIALASATGSGGVYLISPVQLERNTDQVNSWGASAPVWIRVPSSIWKDPNALPTGARIFGTALAPAANTIFTIEAKSPTQISLRLNAICATPADAEKIRKELDDATQLLRKLLTREGMTPRPADLANLLMRGTFTLQGNRVYGEWPLDMALLHSVFEGEVR